MNPYAQYPAVYISTTEDATFSWPPTKQRLSDWAPSATASNVWATGPGIENTTLPVQNSGYPLAIDVKWVGARDPRTMISGFAGPYLKETGLIQDPGDICLQQFMGGRVEATITASLNAQGRVAIIDSKSYPSLYGTKVSPYATVGWENSNTTAGLDPLATPDEEDCFQWFPPNTDSLTGFFALSVSDLMSLVQNTIITGATDEATTHAHFNIPPEGTRWAPWQGNYNSSVPDGYNNATVGGVPARNLCAFLAAGYPLLIISNDADPSATNATIAVKHSAYLAYNVHVPTTGPKANPVLAETAPITPPHAASTSAIRSVPALHNDAEGSKTKHYKESVEASQRHGLNGAAVYIKKPDPVVPRVSSKATSALEPLPKIDPKSVVGGHTDADPMRIFESIPEFDPKKVLNEVGLGDIAETAAPILEGLGALF